MSDPVDIQEDVADSSGLTGFIQERLRSAEDGRQAHEQR